MHGAVEVDLADAEVAAVGGEHFANEQVIGQVFLDTGANPAVIGLRRIRPEVNGELGLDPQEIAPFHGPVVCKLVPLQQSIDQAATLVGVLVPQKLFRLLRGRQGTDDVQIDPANKHPVGAGAGRLDSQPLQLGEHQLVDLALGSRSGGALKNTHGRCFRGRGGDGCCQEHCENQRRFHINSPANVSVVQRSRIHRNATRYEASER